MADLLFFARLVNPHRLYGDIHEKVFNWWTRPDAKDNQLVLLPRDHQKSHCAAVRAAWDITRDPTVTILYVSATSTLAEKQLFAIKSILSCPIYRTLWPEMLHEDEGKRQKWTESQISVDHPDRIKEGIRDSTVFAAGLTTNITGLHAKKVYLDDLVVPANAYTEEGREKVASLYSQLASIESTGASECVVGTRYHPKDLYQNLIEMEESVFNEQGDIIGSENVYEVLQEVVETNGEFLWPKTQRPDGKWFGFDFKELARKEAKYLDRAQFFAQYYNNPNDPESNRVTKDKFQYYEPKLLKRDGDWRYAGRKLNVYAAIDFAFSLAKRADFTALVTVGVDSDNNYYVLDIDRFKTDQISVYFDHILAAHTKWGFRKLRAEVNVSQQQIVNSLKKDYIARNGLVLSIDEHRPTRAIGSKEERIAATLEPRYANGQIYHYRGGNCSLLEDEVCLARPPHDDIKDALSCAIDICVAPARDRVSATRAKVLSHSRFGGVSR